MMLLPRIRISMKLIAIKIYLSKIVIVSCNNKDIDCVSINLMQFIKLSWEIFDAVQFMSNNSSLICVPVMLLS